MRASSMKIGLVLALSLGLAACGGDMDDLAQYINEIKARPGGRIEPLPEITPYEGFTYVADKQGMRIPAKRQERAAQASARQAEAFWPHAEYLERVYAANVAD